MSPELIVFCPVALFISASPLFSSAQEGADLLPFFSRGDFSAGSPNSDLHLDSHPPPFPPRPGSFPSERLAPSLSRIEHLFGPQFHLKLTQPQKSGAWQGPLPPRVVFFRLLFQWFPQCRKWPWLASKRSPLVEALPASRYPRTRCPFSPLF